MTRDPTDSQGSLYPAAPSKPKAVTPAGYYHLPGTGPPLEKCATCAHAVRFKTGRTWMKCGKNFLNWTPSAKTDVLPNSPACRYWKALAALPAPADRDINRGHAIKRWRDRKLGR